MLIELIVNATTTAMNAIVKTHTRTFIKNSSINRIRHGKPHCILKRQPLKKKIYIYKRKSVGIRRFLIRL